VHATEVKVVLAGVAAALTHRASGDTIAVLLIVVLAVPTSAAVLVAQGKERREDRD
jgi:hypothetical protein